MQFLRNRHADISLIIIDTERPRSQQKAFVIIQSVTDTRSRDQVIEVIITISL